MQIMELIDTLFGALNYIPKLAGAVRTAAWRSQARHRQQYSKWELATFTFQRRDKGGKYTLQRVVAHLEKYGVAVVSWNYDGRLWYVKVRKNQGEWATKLLGNASTGGALWTPKRGWKDNR